MGHPDREVMREAVEYGLENHTVGAIVTRSGGIVAKEGGSIVERPDATAHSEIEAIRTACERRESHEPEDCWLYTTFEPCPICMSAACWARMRGVVYGASHRDRNETWRWDVLIPAEEVAERAEHEPEVVGPFMHEEAKEILEL